MKQRFSSNSTAPEHWRCDVGSGSVAVIDVPDALDRRRVFDVDVTLIVRVPAGFDGPWHELTVEIDGKRQWSRRIPSASPGFTDGLDYHRRIPLEAGRALRVRAVAGVHGASVQQLCIEVREDG
ncbi:MAG: hypothetical protein A2W72_12455 [Burkholderiales bacterium RIFCSPLOWO2_12_67_14]|nr:MAG: hypothetical protein A3I64_15180 [Burkholderiales bacterium RIFCSPLOWO2_02_FULL_67_64]OGB42433.1 MAG: hypothetical protein A2W72_12455 [Burkholderiales bacterium RIFCSPLOWO2_12_67_14]OGB44312.1 MAG: hypothetical protein A3E51_01245 [Burkholderiales bacterium RIFCSPHIGHO2_12_FULL_67_38]OGB75781.1 MAG: hypothetical protein A3G82_10320 [Burkholderiales bacterium RIFCSPLOWO2_12_FULL_67_210]